MRTEKGTGAAFKKFKEDFYKEVKTVCGYRDYGKDRIQETTIVSPHKVKQDDLSLIIPPPMSVSLF